MARADPPAADDSIKLVVVGDVGLNKNRQPVRADGFVRGNRLYKWSELTQHITKLIDGDINFMNLETVITDSNKLHPEKKGVNFRTHPNGLAHMLGLGFNLMSLANNHAGDYGTDGVRQTLHNVALQNGKVLGAAGLGVDRKEATEPATFRRRGKSFALGALGINAARRRVGKHHPGAAGARFGPDWRDVTRRLRNTGGEFRMLSVHEGPERRVRPDEPMRKRWRSAMQNGSADLIIGHHSHVVRGIERNKNGFIFYGLGNFLLVGDRNLRRVWSYKLCRDFGLLARVYLRPNERGRLRVRAIQIVPMTGVSRITRRMPAAEARKRVAVLNYLGRLLDDKRSGARGVRFTPQTDGSGLYCEPGAGTDPGRVGHLCAGYHPPQPVSRKLRHQIHYACRRLSASERTPDPLYRSAPASDRRHWR